MRFKLLLLFICLLTAGAVSAQSKKDLEKSLKAEKAISDSLRKELDVNKTILDSLTAGKILADSLDTRDPYKNFYNYVYTKYLKPGVKQDTVDLTIQQATSVLDSLVVVRSTKLAKADTSAMQYRDSIAQIKGEKERTEIELQSLKRLIAEVTGADRLPVNGSDFKGKWEMYMIPLVVMGNSPQSAVLNTGATGMSDSLYHVQQERIPRSISFGENDLADITFMGGRTTNCFYKIVGYDAVKPFYIDLDRGEDLKLRMHAVNTNRGLQVSVELPTGTDEPKRYLFGYMKR